MSSPKWSTSSKYWSTSSKWSTSPSPNSKWSDSLQPDSLQSMAKYTRLHQESDDQPRALKVFMYKAELDKIHEWVLMKPDIETGGDLFGLWIDEHTAVVQFVLGPGKGCRRTKISFYQDVAYLDKAGKYLTQTHGLCNIGQWHSHHRLSLAHPSGGDENTVWGNMPNLGLNRYIVFIATIKGWRSQNMKARVNCFLFEIQDNQKLPVLKGEFDILQDTSPLHINSAVASVMVDGAEVKDTQVTINEETSQERRYCRSSHLKAMGIALIICLIFAIVVLLLITYKHSLFDL